MYTSSMRDKLIFIGVAVVAVVVGVLVFLSGGTAASDSSSSIVNNQPSAAVVVPFTKLIQGTQSKIAGRVNYNIVSSSELSALWKSIGAKGTPPAVDFTKQTVLAVFAGTESTSSIEIAKIEDTNSRLVSISIAKTVGACAQKVGTTSSYEMAAVSVSSLPLTHKDVLTTVPCKN